MKTKQLTLRQQSSVACPTCYVAAGKQCVLAAGGPRNEPHSNRRVAAAAFLALVAALKKKLAKPQLTKSVREKATKKQIASWTQVC